MTHITAAEGWLDASTRAKAVLLALVYPGATSALLHHSCAWFNQAPTL